MLDLDELEFFRKIKFFQMLGDQERFDFLSACAKRSFAAGATLMHQGDEGDSMIVIRSGEAEVFIGDAAGQKVVLAHLGPGAVVGEMALVDPAPRSATIQALTALAAYEIDRRSFAKLGADRNPAFLKVMRNIAQLLCERLRSTYEIVGDMLLPPQQLEAKRKMAEEKAKEAAARKATAVHQLDHASLLTDLWRRLKRPK